MLQKLDALYFWARFKMNTFLRDEKGEVNIVAMVVLIGVAVLLAIVFKDAISNLINDLLKTITQKAKTTVENEL